MLRVIHGVIAVYAPAEFVRRVAWDAVKRLHKWDAKRILLFPASRTHDDSPFAAAGVVAQQATGDAEAVLETAAADPNLEEHSSVLLSAKREVQRIRRRTRTRTPVDTAP